MTQAPRKRGWCPSLYEPMQTGDGLLVRVKPPQARLTPIQAQALARAAAHHGNGIIELTQRGNLQVRGLSPATTAPFAAVMVDAGLADPDPAQEARRAVMPPPLLGDDPGLACDAAGFTARLNQAFAADPRLAALPGKLAVFVDAGGVLGARPAAASLIAWTDGTANGLRPGHRDDAPVLAGPLPYPGTADMAFGLAPPFAQLDSGMLRHAADLAARWGTSLRVTPWRTLLLGRIPASACIDAGPAWITSVQDPRLRVTACIGAPGCQSGSTPTRADAARLTLKLCPAHTVHVSGCSKGCAHPSPAPLTLVGRDGRYDVVLHGQANAAPVRTGFAVAELVHHLLSSPGLTGKPPASADAWALPSRDGRVKPGQDSPFGSQNQ